MGFESNLTSLRVEMVSIRQDIFRTFLFPQKKPLELYTPSLNVDFKIINEPEDLCILPSKLSNSNQKISKGFEQ